MISLISIKKLYMEISITIDDEMMPINAHFKNISLSSRPFQRTITMHKDSSGHVGFIFKSGRVTSLVKDGSAARNGLLTEHYICEINGQNVIGLKVRGAHQDKSPVLYKVKYETEMLIYHKQYLKINH